jgi:hypothetical protein
MNEAYMFFTRFKLHVERLYLFKMIQQYYTKNNQPVTENKEFASYGIRFKLISGFQPAEKTIRLQQIKSIAAGTLLRTGDWRKSCLLFWHFWMLPINLLLHEGCPPALYLL